MIGRNAPRYAQPRPHIGRNEITKSSPFARHIHLAVVNSGLHPEPAPHDKSLIEELNLDPRDLTNQYIKAIRDFIKDGAQSEGSYKQLVATMGSKWLLTKYIPTIAERFGNLKVAGVIR